MMLGNSLTDVILFDYCHSCRSGFFEVSFYLHTEPITNVEEFDIVFSVHKNGLFITKQLFNNNGKPVELSAHYVMGPYDDERKITLRFSGYVPGISDSQYKSLILKPERMTVVTSRYPSVTKTTLTKEHIKIELPGNPRAAGLA